MPNSKRIFLDATTLCTNHSGTGMYTETVLKYLQSRTDIQVDLGLRRSFACSSQGASLANHPRTTSLLLSENPHIALNHQLAWNGLRSNCVAGIFPNYFMPLGWHAPAAVTIHDISFITHPQFYSRKMVAWYRRRIRHTLKHARIILTVSEASKHQIITHLGVDADRIIVHPPSAAHRIDTASSPHSSPYLLYIGNIEPKKNVLNMIEGFAAANIPKLDLVIAGKLHKGGSGWRRKLQSIVDRNPHVLCTGYLPKKQLDQYLVNASGLLQFSHCEGFGISLLDALSNDIPCAISRDSALLELADGNAHTADANRIDSIADAIQALNFSPHPPARHIAQHYHKDAVHERLNEVTERLLHHVRPTFVMPEYPESSTYIPIISAIAYSAVFRTPIALDKLTISTTQQAASPAEFEQKLNTILRAMPNLVYKKEGQVHFLPALFGKSVSGDLFDRPDVYPPKKDHPSSASFRIAHHRLIRRLATLPWIKAVYYSGGTAHQQAVHTNEDLDVFIVAARNRVWLAWLATRFLSGNSVRLCTNYLVDEAAQQITWQQDFYTAHQLLFLRQVVRKSGVDHIRQHNPFVYQTFPNLPAFRKMHTSDVASGCSSVGKTGRIGDAINAVICISMTFWWNKGGKHSGFEGTLWDLHRIKLHTNDHRPAVLNVYSSVLQKLTLQFKAIKNNRRSAVTERIS